MDDLHLMDEANGMTFDPKRLDMEGRAVVCDFGSAKTAEWAPASRLYQPVRPVQPLLAQRNGRDAAALQDELSESAPGESEAIASSRAGGDRRWGYQHHAGAD